MVDQSKIGNVQQAAAAFQTARFEGEHEILQVMIDPDCKTSGQRVLVKVIDPKSGKEFEQIIEIPTRFKELATINATTSNLDSLDKYLANFMWYHANSLRGITENSTSTVFGRKIKIDLLDAHNNLVDDLGGLLTLNKSFKMAMAQLVQTKKLMHIQESQSHETISQSEEDLKKKDGGFFNFIPGLGK